jgi:8-hydroxy-5-deazaflavin:NADPH oxidoreductase
VRRPDVSPPAGHQPMTADFPDLADLSQLTIGVLGGTGAQGRGLAYWWALGGLSVMIDSQHAARI